MSFPSSNVPLSRHFCESKKLLIKNLKKTSVFFALIFKYNSSKTILKIDGLASK
jgi:hypothetical protein